MLLACACEDHGIYLWDAVKGVRHSVLNGHEGVPRFLAFHPGGDLLASTGWDMTLRLWDPWAGKQRLVCPATDCPPRFSSDGGRLAFGVDGHAIGIWEVVAGRECRTLRGHERTSDGPVSVDISPDGLRMASAGDGVRLWDLDSAAQVASLPIGSCELALFRPDGKALITGGLDGLRSWPFEVRPGLGPRIGPPTPIHTPGALTPLRGSLDAAGRTIAVVDPGRRRVAVVPLDGRSAPAILDDQPDLMSVALSPDGRWVATGTWHGTSGAKVWDARDGGEPRLLVRGDARVAFSPDGRWLVTGTADEYRFWEVATWRPGLTKPRDQVGLPGPMAFTPDGRMFAIASTNWDVRLIDPATGRDLAKLTAPDPQPISWIDISPDGGHLAVGCDSRQVQLWDMHLVRRQLAGMGLDW